ncbi:MAG: MucB/RseB C-terminal domain-containing protein [Steroidobacteraceae bacterium]
MRMRSFILTLALLWAAGVSAATSSEDARALIKRMNDALINRNYQGVLTHRWSGGSDTLRLIHRMRDGHMVERVISLNGSGFEIVRDGTRFVQYFPARPGAKPGAKRIAVAEKRSRSYGYISALNGVSAGSEKYYAISSGGTQRLLGWPTATQFVSVEPRDALRYGYRLWLDPQSAMPIKTQLVTKAGEVVDEISFSELQLMEAIPDDLLKPAVNPNDFQWKKPADLHAESVKQAFVPRADLLPLGFRVLTAITGAEVQGAGPKTHFIVSDGISWASVVVTVASKSSDRFTEGFLPAMYAQVNYVIKRDKHYISVMGEVPPDVAKKIAGAVLPE